MLLEVDIAKKRGAFSLVSRFALSEEKCGIFGPSGSGKSTLMHILAGLSTPDRGRIVFDGRVLFDHEKKINLDPAERRIGVVFQHSHLFPHLNAEKNLLYGWQRTARAERRFSPEAVIRALDLEGLLKRNVHSLSGGERQRVALGRTMLSCPRLILLDEPLTGLDRGLKSRIIPYLRRALEEFDTPLLFISHSLQEIQLMTEQVLVFGEEEIELVAAEELARQHLTSGDRGYTNLLHLGAPVLRGDLWCYRWRDTELILTDGGSDGDNLFQLGAKDITLFKELPLATSARNILDCEVIELFGSGNRLGVVLDCRGGRLVSQVVPESARELGIMEGSRVVAVIKASAFRKLY